MKEEDAAVHAACSHPPVVAHHKQRPEHGALGNPVEGPRPPVQDKRGSAQSKSENTAPSAPLVDGDGSSRKSRHNGDVSDQECHRLEGVFLPACSGDGVAQVGLHITL